MTDEQLLERITLHQTVMVGKPVIRGTRLTVEYVLNLLAHGATADNLGSREWAPIRFSTCALP